MDVEDFLFEGVKNSIEAGCGSIVLSYREEDDEVHVRIGDDGKYEGGRDVFASGCSTKGDNRGRGLSLLKSVCPDAALERKDGCTFLSYSYPLKLKTGLSSVLPFLFSMCFASSVSLSVNIVRDGISRTFTSREMAQKGPLDRSGSIIRMKRDFEFFD